MSDEVGILHPKVLILSLGVSTSVILSFRVYKRHFSRIRSYLDLTPDMLEGNRKLFGRVTRVGDGDNFRFYHMPGGVFLGWGWLKHVPTKKADLKEQTLMIRLCGVDAPEMPHWGKPGQPYAEEALKWLKGYLLGRNVVVTPYLIDQYKRVVARAQVWKWTGRKDISAEMLKRGLGVVYESKVGAQFGGKENYYRKLEARAKRWHRGLWSLGKNLKTPGEFKKIYYKE